jgi:hypothetical protein
MRYVQSTSLPGESHVQTLATHSAVPGQRGALASGLKLAVPVLTLVGTGRHHGPPRSLLVRLLDGLRNHEAGAR